MCLHIDDTLCTGDIDAIGEFNIDLKDHFSIKEEGEMKEYVGYKVKKTGKSSLIMYQDDLIEQIERIFWEKVKNM